MEKVRTIDDIFNDIDDVHSSIFYEEMADYMNWDVYYRLIAKLRSLENELKELKEKGENNDK